MRLKKLNRQRGAGNAKAIVVLVLFIIFLYAAFRIIPHFVNNYELNDFCQTEARAYSYNQRTESEIKGNIMRKIQELDIPATANQVRIVKNERRVRINIDYTVSVAFPGYTFTKDFSIAVDNQGV